MHKVSRCYGNAYNVFKHTHRGKVTQKLHTAVFVLLLQPLLVNCHAQVTKVLILQQYNSISTKMVHESARADSVGRMQCRAAQQEPMPS